MFPGTNPGRWLEDGLPLAAGGHELTVIHTPDPIANSPDASQDYLGEINEFVAANEPRVII